MATTGSRTFNPSLGELTLFVYGLLGIRRTQLLQEHMADACLAANLVQTDWLNRGVNLWQVDTYVIPLFEEVGQYAVDPSVLSILDAYVTSGDLSAQMDRVILPVSRTEFASYVDKNMVGFPTTFWFDRTLSPVVNLWPVPDGTQISLTIYVLKQPEDAALSSAMTVFTPYAWLNAFAYAMAVKLAPIWAPDRLTMLVPLAKDAYDAAATANIETAAQYFAPMLGSYYR